MRLGSSRRWQARVFGHTWASHRESGGRGTSWGISLPFRPLVEVDCFVRTCLTGASWVPVRIERSAKDDAWFDHRPGPPADGVAGTRTTTRVGFLQESVAAERAVRPTLVDDPSPAEVLDRLVGHGLTSGFDAAFLLGRLTGLEHVECKRAVNAHPAFGGTFG